MALVRANNNAVPATAKTKKWVYAYIAASCKIFAAHAIFSKKNYDLAMKAAKKLLAIETITDDAEKKAATFHLIEFSSFYRRSVIIKRLNALAKHIFTTTSDDFDYDTATKPYFDYLRVFIGKSPWQTKTFFARTKHVKNPGDLMPDLPNLPIEMWERIFWYLPFTDRMMMRKVNTSFKEFFDVLPITENIVDNDMFMLVVNLPRPDLPQQAKEPTYPRLLARVAHDMHAISTDEKGTILSAYRPAYLPSVEEMLFDDNPLIIAGYGVGASIGAIGLLIAIPMSLAMHIPYLAALCVFPVIPIFFLSIAASACVIAAGMMIYKAVVYSQMVDNAIKVSATHRKTVGFFKQVEEAKELTLASKEESVPLAIDMQLG